jgi:hypothetical protein
LSAETLVIPLWLIEFSFTTRAQRRVSGNLILG